MQTFAFLNVIALYSFIVEMERLEEWEIHVFSSLANLNSSFKFCKIFHGIYSLNVQAHTQLKLKISFRTEHGGSRFVTLLLSNMQQFLAPFFFSTHEFIVFECLNFDVSICTDVIEKMTV